MVAAVQRISSFVLKPITVPLKWIVDKIRWIARKFFGFILRVSVFQLGEYKKRFAYFIMRTYQKLMSDPREEKPLDHTRLAESESLLLQFGAVPMSIPFAKNAQVRCMTFTAERFFERIRELGGEKREITLRSESGKEEQRFVILPTPDAKADSYKELLHLLNIKFSLPRLSVQVGDEVQEGILLPESPQIPEGQSPPMIFHSHSPGRSMAMDRKILGLFLGAGYNICVWDPPGTIDSTGTPSEGSYYIAADAIFQYLRKLGYPTHRIWLSGYCEGAAIAAYLKWKYHAEGVNFVAQNPFNSLLDMAKNQGLLGRLFAELSMSEIQSTDPKITSRVKQNGFNLEEWFKGLLFSIGKFFLIHTDTDKVVPLYSIERLKKAIGNAGPYFEYQRVHPNRNSNGHLEMPLLDKNTWHHFVEVVC